MFGWGSKPTPESRCALSVLDQSVVVRCILPLLTSADLAQLCGVNKRYRSAYGELDALWKVVAQRELPAVEYDYLAFGAPKPPVVLGATTTAGGVKVVPERKSHPPQPRKYWKRAYTELIVLRDDRKSFLNAPKELRRFPRHYLPHAAKQYSMGGGSTGSGGSSATNKITMYRAIMRSCTNAVGLSSLLRRFARDKFETQYKATIGADFEAVKCYPRGFEVNLQCWYALRAIKRFRYHFILLTLRGWWCDDDRDTAEYSSYYRCGPGLDRLFRTSDATLLGFSVTDRQSFDALKADFKVLMQTALDLPEEDDDSKSGRRGGGGGGGGGDEKKRTSKTEDGAHPKLVIMIGMKADVRPPLSSTFVSHIL